MRSVPLIRSFAYVAAIGLWLPQAEGAILVDLDATQLTLGPLATWPNTGTDSGNFTSAGTQIPEVVTIGTPAVKGVAFVGGTGGADGTHYIGPAANVLVTSFNPRTIEAWIYNTSPQGEEVVVAWGRRGGPDGSNCSFGHGTSPDFGAIGHWGAPDLGWDGDIVFGRWTYIAYTYDGGTASVYFDGELASSDAVALDTWATDDTDPGGDLRYRVARQNEANGTPSGVGVGGITIAKIRIHDTALDAAAIKARFDGEKAQFGLADTDSDGLPDWYEGEYAFLDPANAADAALDQDSDGLTNLAEFTAGTNPGNADTDGDTLSDGAEVNRMSGGSAAPTNPRAADTDGDGLGDGVETDTGTYVSVTDTGTDPLDSDSDDDTVGDQQEVQSGSNPLNATSVPGANRPPIIDLDAATLPPGPLNVWTNNGTAGGVFTAPEGAPAPVQTVQSVTGVSLNGTSHYYTGPATPSFITGNSSRTVEAWINNPSAADEETIFSWGRRGGPDGSNTSFNHGLNAAFGAVGHWGAPDIGWTDPANVKQGQWTYVVYTYDGPTMTTRVYAEGAEVGSEELPAPLNTHSTDTSGNPLRFRVGSQTDAGGAATGGLRGSMIIAEVRVYDRVLDAAQIQANYEAGTDKFGLVDYDNDGLPTWYERQYSFLDERTAADAAADQDSDGLTNLAEFEARTLPDNPDTDGDGVDDGDEVNRSGGATNPLQADTDQDGLTDKAEADGGTDPLMADSDGDLFADGQEVFHGSDPRSTTSVPTFTTPVALVDLQAAALPEGALNVWTNSGAMNGVFRASPDSAAPVGAVSGVRAVTLDGTSQYYTGPAAPVFLAGNGDRTVDAWIYNPTVAGEETVVAWGRRGGPDSSNASFIHGTDATFGALGHWGADGDVGWNGATNVVAGAWTHVAYTYVGTTQTAAVYKDGVLANTETFAAPLNTWATDNTGDPGQPLPFRVGAQNVAAGGPGGGFGSLSIARLRVYDQALDAAAIAAIYNAERNSYAGFSIEDIQLNAQTGAVTLTWTAAAGTTYAVDASPDLETWTAVGTGLTTGTFTETPPAGAGTARYYRLRIE